MKSFLTAICTISFLLVSASFGAQDKGTAQDKSTAAKQCKEVRQDTKTTTADRTAKVSTDTVYGKIESYEPGKSIKVTVPGTVVSTKSFTLDSKDETVNVAPNLKNGDWVSVMEKTDNNGHKTVTVKPSSEKHATKVKKTR